MRFGSWIVEIIHPAVLCFFWLRKMSKKEGVSLRFLLAAVIASWQGKSGDTLRLESREDRQI